MPPSTMRQVTILQLGPTELSNLREGEVIRIPISPEMAVLMQAGMAELYLGLVGARKSPKRDALPEAHIAGELPVHHRHHTGPMIKWSNEETYRVMQQYDKLDNNLGIGKRLQTAQQVALPPERHRKFNSTGKSTLESLRKSALAFAKSTAIAPQVENTPPLNNCFVVGCDGGGKTPAGLAGHLATKHGKRLPKVNGVTHFQCRECKIKKEFASWSEFLGHLEAIHGKK